MTAPNRDLSAVSDRYRRQRLTHSWVTGGTGRVGVVTFLLVMTADIPIMYASLAARLDMSQGMVSLLSVGISGSLTLTAALAARQLAMWLADRYVAQFVLFTALTLGWAGAIACLWAYRTQTHAAGALGDSGATALSTLVAVVLALTGLIQATESFARYDPAVRAHRHLRRRLRWLRLRAQRLAARRALLQHRSATRAARAAGARTRIGLLTEAFHGVARERLMVAGRSPDITEWAQRHRTSA